MKFPIFTIWREELKNIYRDIGVVLFFIVVPFIYPVLYSIIYNPEVMRETPMVVVDMSHSTLSRDFVRRIDATPDVQVYKYASNMEEAKEIVNSKKAYGILFIPQEFSQDIHRGKQTTVSLYADMSGLLFYKAVLLATTEASLEMRKIVNVNAIELPVPYEAISLYNTQNGFASFLVPGILVLVVQQTLLLGISMICATTRERNRGALVPHNPIYSDALRTILGKVMAYLTVYIFMSIWVFIVMPSLFHFPHLANEGTLALFILPYLLACIFFSMVVAAFIRGRETPMMILVFTSLPILFMSGISWPQTAIPAFWKYFGYLFPSTFGIQGFVKLNSMGASLNEIAFEYKALWLQTGIYFIITLLIYKISLLLHKNKI